MDQVTPRGLSAEELLALDLEFDLWVMEGACVHRNMEIASERISNWGGLRQFQHALHHLGRDLYPALLREIPDGNGGMTKPADARTCLAELDRFRATGPFSGTVELVDVDKGEVIHSRIEPYDGWLSTNADTGVSHRLTVDGAL